MEVLTQQQLYRFLSLNLPLSYFRLFMHILTNPYLKLLANLPKSIREVSEIYLDGEKYKTNNYAVLKLREAGYRYVWYVNKLHSKVVIIGTKPDYIILGSSNLSERSFSNLETVLLISNPTSSVVKGIDRVLVKPALRGRYDPSLRMSQFKG